MACGSDVDEQASNGDVNAGRSKCMLERRQPLLVREPQGLKYQFIAAAI